MKLRHTVILLCSLLGIATANANITMRVPLNACDNIAGPWKGHGKLSADIIVKKIKCTYNGKAIVQSTGAATFTMNINLTKESGICPQSKNFQLDGICQDGILTMSTDGADLTGYLNDDGTVAEAQGTIAVEVLGMTIKANVDEMHLEKMQA